MKAFHVTLGALALFSISSQAALAAYDCNLELTETVWVKRITAVIPSSVDVDFKKGVPEEYVQKTEEFNPHLFDGSYESLLFSAHGANYGEESATYDVLYRKELTTAYSVTILDECADAPGADRCLLLIDQGDGSKPHPLVMLSPESQDQSQAPVMITGSVLASREAGNVRFDVGNTKFAIVKDERGDSSASIELPEGTSRFTLATSNDQGNAGPLAVSAKMTCTLRGDAAK